MHKTSALGCKKLNGREFEQDAQNLEIFQTAYRDEIFFRKTFLVLKPKTAPFKIAPMSHLVWKSISIAAVFLIVIVNHVQAAQQSAPSLSNQLRVQAECESLLSAPPTHSFPRTYHIMPRLFKGGLNGIEAELPNLKRLGIDAIWLGPVHPQTLDVHYYLENGETRSTLNDHGYWVADHGAVDSNLGGEAAFESLLNTAQSLGIKVLLDIPVNHMGYGDELQFGGRSIVPSERPELFLQGRGLVAADYEHFESLESADELVAKQEEISQMRLMGLNDLNHAHPEVREYLLRSYKKFIDMGVSGFRVDAVKHLPIEFLVWFVNSLDQYGQRHHQDLIFLLEFLTHRERTFEVFSEQILARLKNPQNVFMIDFPLQSYLRSTHWNTQLLGEVVEFLKVNRGSDRAWSSHYIPMFVDHDFGGPLPHPMSELLVHVIGDFSSQQPTMIHHGSEQSGHLQSGRQHVEFLKANGDIGQVLKGIHRGRHKIDPQGLGVNVHIWGVFEGVAVIEQEGTHGHQYLFATMQDSPSHLIWQLPKEIATRLKLQQQMFLSGEAKWNVDLDGTLNLSLPDKGFAILSSVQAP